MTDGTDPVPLPLPPPPLPAPTSLPHVGSVCQMCGSWPAQRMVYRSQAALVFVAQTQTSDVQACRNCGLALGRKVQNRTLLTGWWGIISFFRNWVYVAKNAGELRTTSRMQPPTGGRAGEPGRPVFARPGFLLATVGVIVAVVLVVVDVNRHDPKWEVGGCVSGTSSVQPVSCADPHDGKIVALVSVQLLCPDFAEGYVRDSNGFVWCIDTSL